MDNSPLNSYNVIASIHRSRRFSLYHANSIETGKEVLIKTPDALRLKDSDLANTLLKEAETHIRLSHPGIRAGYEAREDNGITYFLGEYLAGMSLAKYLTLNDSTKDTQRNLLWSRELLAAMAYAQSQNVVHLNLNPYNLIVDNSGQLRVIGFGKNKTAWLNGEEGSGTYHPLLYIAPELFQAGAALAASDIYSWAVIVYQLFCGVLPWRIDLLLTSEQQKQQSLCRAVIMPEILKKEVPDWLFAMLLQCLKLDPQLRYANAGELEAQFDLQSLPPSETEVELSPEPDTPKETAVIDETMETEPETPEPEPVIPDPIPELPVETPEDSLLALMEEPDLPELEVVSLPEPDYLFPSEPAISVEPTPEPVIEPEPTPPTPEPEPPIVQAEPIQTTPVQAVAATPPPAATNSEPPKPKPQSSGYATWKPVPPAEKEAGKLKKTFKLLLWASLAIVLFVLVKYIAFNPHPHFGNQSDSLDLALPEQHPTEENQPLSLIKVPGDTLVMGSIDPQAEDDEFPLLTVSVPTFYISKTEITQQQWLMVFENNPAFNRDNKLPVENVSFYDAIEFCNAKSLKDGYTPCYEYVDTEVICNFDADGYRLPTEAEWEFAAKAGKRRDFLTYSGSNQADEVGWFNVNSDAKSHPVASKKANQLGIYDLSGNLYEWVWNWYAPYSYRFSDQFRGPESGTDKVIRGGSWYHAESEMRVTNRNFAKPFQKSPYLGFRVVRCPETSL